MELKVSAFVATKGSNSSGTCSRTNNYSEINSNTNSLNALLLFHYLHDLIATSTRESIPNVHIFSFILITRMI